MRHDGFSPRYGAREIQRAVEQHVVAAIARTLFADVLDATTLSIDIVDGVVQVRAC